MPEGDQKRLRKGKLYDHENFNKSRRRKLIG
jgi:hypothetical protein